MLTKSLQFIALYFVVIALLITPEIAFRQIMELPEVVFSSLYIGLLSILTLSLLLDRGLRWVQLTLILLAIILLTQFAHMAYFGRAFSPSIFALLGQETAEISESILATLPKLWWIIPLVFAPLIAVYFLVKKVRPFHGIPWLGMFAILVLVFGVYRPSNFGSVIRTFPNPHKPALENYLTALGGYVFHLALNAPSKLPDFAPYRIEPLAQQPSEDTTIVILYGESLGARNFSALDYYRETTPKLEALLQNPESTLHNGMSTGISTRVSTPLFFNAIRDPRDRENVLSGHTNIFKLAKQQGFETYYFSAQKVNLLASVDTRHIDHILTKDTHGELFDRRWDEGLLDLVQQEISLSKPKKRLVALHTRSAHSPYEKNIQFRPELAVYPNDLNLPYAELTRNNYDNAIRYNDYIIDSLYQYFLAKTEGSLYFWLTSDHGELIDHKGRFGHIILDPVVAEVPIGLLSRAANPKIVQDFRNAEHLTHWDLTRYILQSVGLELIDPNPNPHLRYVSGTGTFASHGMMILEPKQNGEWSVEKVQ